MDRYGCTRRAEQYQGWAALPPSGEGVMSADEAEALIRHLGDPLDELEVKEAYRQAAKTLHPDVGGDPAQWKRLDRAAQVLGL